MSNVIDDRVVQMSFDNRNFETNVQQSLKTIDKLNSSLKATESTTAFDTLDKSAKKLNFDSLIGAVETVSSRFSNFGIIGMAVLENLANKAVDVGLRMVKAFSIDQVSAGWDKYAEKTTAIQTIMAATASSWEKTAKEIGFTGTQIEFVESQMKKLNWFTDETSYNFTDMASNIGKFTSNGVKLDDAATAMQGIANWAAISGQNAQTASRAMYNISQAMGTGKMTLLDWKTIEGANMGTEEFKRTALEAGEAAGLLKKDLKETKKTGIDTWTTNVKGVKKTKVTVDSFRDSLQKGWFTSKVMLDVFNQYGGAADALYELSEASTKVLSTNKILDSFDDYSEGVTTLDEVSKELGIDVDVLTKQFNYLSTDVGKFGLKAFKAGQEAKTFAEVLSSTSDAVSTGWMKIFQDIFGNYDEAKVLWTGLANYLFEVFVEPLNSAHEVLLEWKAQGGWATIFAEDEGAAWRLGGALSALIQPAKDALAAVFPNTTDPKWWVEQLLKLSDGFSKLVDKMTPSEKTADRLQRIFQGLFSLIDLGRNFFNALGRVLKEYLYPIFSKLFDKAFDGAATLGDLIGKLRDYVNENDTFYEILKKIAETIKTGFEKAGEIVGKLSEKFTELTGIELHLPKFENFADVLERIKGIGDRLKGVLEDLRIVFENFKAGISGNEQVMVLGDDTENINKLSGIFYKLGTALGWVVDKVTEFKNAFGEKFKEIFNGKGIKIGNILKIAASVLIFKKAFDFAKARLELKNIFKSIKKTFAALPGIFEGVTSAFEAFAFNNNALALKNIAIAIGILTVALIALSFVDGEKIAISLGAITLMIGELVGAMAILQTVLGGPLSSMLKASALKKTASAMLQLGAAVALMAISMKILGSMDAQELDNGLGAVTASLILLCSAVAILDKIGVKKITGIGTSMLMMAAAMIVMAVAIKQMGSLDMDTMTQGFIGVAGAMGILVFALGLLQAFGVEKVAGIGLGMILMSAALLVLQVAMAKFAEMDGEDLARGLVVIAASLFIFCGALALCQGNLAGAAAILIIAAALNVLVPVIRNLGEMDLGTLAQGLIALAVALGIFVIAGQFGASTGVSLILLAAGMLAMDLALAALIPSLQKLGAMSIEEIGKAFLVLAGAFGVLILAAAAAEPLALGLAILTVAFVGLGAAAVLVGAGMGLAISAIQNLCNISNLEQAANDLELMALSFVQLGGAGVILLAAVPGIAAFALGLAGLLPPVAGLATSLPQTVDALLKMEDVKQGIKGSAEIAANLKTLASGFKELAKSDKDINKAVAAINSSVVAMVQYVTLKEQIVAVSPEISKTIISLLQNIVNQMKLFMPQFMSTGLLLITNFQLGMISARNLVISAADSIARAGVSAAREYHSQFYSAGAYLGEGFVSGIRSKKSSAKTAGGELGKSAQEGLEGSLGISSPSKVGMQIGAYFTQGFAVGIKAQTKEAEDATSDMLTGVLDTARTLGEMICQKLEEEGSPVITPVLDTSMIEAGATRFSNTLHGISIPATVNRASLAGAAFASGTIQNGSGEGSYSTNNYFTQNNYSPKSLSRIDIYRQTKNLFTAEKGAVKR